MKIETGRGSITLTTLLAVWSLSLAVNLPGLAITPVMNVLKEQFSATTFDVQLLTMLPNFCIIPFMILSGRLSVNHDKSWIAILALVAFVICGIGFFFAHTMSALIALSCMLGCACGMVIPIAAALVADTFEGKYRVTQLGIKSGIANISLVAATFVVGWLAQGGNWRLPFLVYLVPIIPLLLSKWLLRLRTINATMAKTNGEYTKNIDVKGDSKVKNGLILPQLFSLMILYFSITYLVIVLPYYLGFDDNQLGINDKDVSIVTSLFYMAIFTGGATLSYTMRAFRSFTAPVAALCIAVGVGIVAMQVPMIVMCVCAVLLGYGYGVLQPMIYNKTTESVTVPEKTTLALSWVMCINYLSIAFSPVIVDEIRSLFHASGNIFPFYLNGILGIVFVVIALIYRNSFVFNIKKEYYS